jgi:hypothetical protein
MTSISSIKLFKDEVQCDISILEVCDVLLGKPYNRKHHVFYESRPHSVILTLVHQLYMTQEVDGLHEVDRLQEVSPYTRVSLIISKDCMKVISQNRRFVLFMVQ